MFRLLKILGQLQGATVGYRRLPWWGRWLVGLFAIPGLVLLGLSIVALVVSVFALLLLTVPVVRLVNWVGGRPVDEASVRGFGGGGFPTDSGDVFTAAPFGASFGGVVETPRRRAIEVKIVEEEHKGEGP